MSINFLVCVIVFCTFLTVFEARTRFSSRDISKDPIISQTSDSARQLPNLFVREKKMPEEDSPENLTVNDGVTHRIEPDGYFHDNAGIDLFKYWTHRLNSLTRSLKLDGNEQISDTTEDKGMLNALARALQNKREYPYTQSGPSRQYKPAAYW